MKELDLINALNSEGIARKELIELENITIKKSIDYLKDNTKQMVIIAYEEMSELQQTLTKEMRGKGQRISVLEEYVDVMLGLKYLSAIYDLKLDTYKKYKPAENIDLMKVCHHLSQLQESIYSSLNGDTSSLRGKCTKVARELTNVKKYFSLTDEEIDKIMLCKVNRLSSRIDNNQLI